MHSFAIFFLLLSLTIVKRSTLAKIWGVCSPPPPHPSRFLWVWIKLFKKYTEAAKNKESEEKFIFRKICHSKQGFKLNLDKPISYTTVRNVLLTDLKNIGLYKTQFGLHSLRSRGATAAAHFVINDRLFQKHGRWKSENVKNGYVQRNNLRALLSVSINLRLGSGALTLAYRRLHYCKILYFIPLPVYLRDKEIRLFSFDKGISNITSNK